MLADFIKQIADLLRKDEVIRMEYYPGHRVYHRSSMRGKGGTVYSKKVRLDHCLRVAYISYTVAGVFGLERRAVARAGLLHDCGYDPQSHESRVTQILKHPLRGALISHQLGETYDVSRAIYSHMFPINPGRPPATGTSLVIWFADKVDAVLETISFSTVLDKILNHYKINSQLDKRSVMPPRIRKHVRK